jgi:hypothetical protein
MEHEQPQKHCGPRRSIRAARVRGASGFSVAFADRRVQSPWLAGDGPRSRSRKTGLAAPARSDRAVRPQRSKHSSSRPRLRRERTKALHPDPTRPCRHRRDHDRRHGYDRARARRDCATRHGHDGPPPPTCDDWSPALRSRQRQAPPRPPERSRSVCTAIGRNESRAHRFQSYRSILVGRYASVQIDRPNTRANCAYLVAFGKDPASGTEITPKSLGYRQRHCRLNVPKPIEHSEIGPKSSSCRIGRM